MYCTCMYIIITTNNGTVITVLHITFSVCIMKTKGLKYKNATNSLKSIIHVHVNVHACVIQHCLPTKYPNFKVVTLGKK